MFIIERRTAGVLAALAIPVAMAVLGNIWDRVNEVAGPSTANSTAAVVTSVGPDVRDNRFLAGQQTGSAGHSCAAPNRDAPQHIHDGKAADHF